MRIYNETSALIYDFSPLNEMNGILGHLFAHMDSAGPGEPPGDGEMKEMPTPPRKIFEIRILAVSGRAR